MWLIPIEDRRKQGALHEGMREGFTFGQYLMLVDYTSRLGRDSWLIRNSKKQGWVR